MFKPYHLVEISLQKVLLKIEIFIQLIIDFLLPDIFENFSIIFDASKHLNCFSLYVILQGQ